MSKITGNSLDLNEFKISLRETIDRAGGELDTPYALLVSHRYLTLATASVRYLMRDRPYLAPIHHVLHMKLRKEAGGVVSGMERISASCVLGLLILLHVGLLVLPILLWCYWFCFAVILHCVLPFACAMCRFKRSGSFGWFEIFDTIFDSIAITGACYALYLTVLIHSFKNVLYKLLPLVWVLFKSGGDMQVVAMDVVSTTVASVTIDKFVGLHRLDKWCASCVDKFEYFDKFFESYVEIDIEARRVFAKKFLAFLAKYHLGRVGCDVARLALNFSGLVLAPMSFLRRATTILLDVGYVYVASTILAIVRVVPPCVAEILDLSDAELKLALDVTLDVGATSVPTLSREESVDTALLSSPVDYFGRSRECELDEFVGTTFDAPALSEDSSTPREGGISRIDGDKRRSTPRPMCEPRRTLYETRCGKGFVVCGIPFETSEIYDALLESYKLMVNIKENFSTYYMLRLDNYNDMLLTVYNTDKVAVEPMQVYMNLNVTLEGYGEHHLEVVARYTSGQYESVRAMQFVTGLSFKCNNKVYFAEPAICVASEGEVVGSTILVYYKFIFFYPFKASCRVNLKDASWRTFVLHLRTISRSGYAQIVYNVATNGSLEDAFGPGPVDLSTIPKRSVGSVSKMVMVPPGSVMLMDDVKTLYPSLQFVYNTTPTYSVDHPNCQVLNSIHMKLLSAELSKGFGEKIVHFSSRGPSRRLGTEYHNHRYPIINIYDVMRYKAILEDFSSRLDDTQAFLRGDSYTQLIYLLNNDIMHTGRLLLRYDHALMRFLLRNHTTYKLLTTPDTFDGGGVGVMYHLSYYFCFNRAIRLLRSQGFSVIYYTYHEDFLATLVDEWKCDVTEMRCRKRDSSLQFYTTGAGGKYYNCSKSDYLTWVLAPAVGVVDDVHYAKEKLAINGSLVTYKLQLVSGSDEPTTNLIDLPYSYILGNVADAMTGSKSLVAVKLNGSVFNKFVTALLPKLKGIKVEDFKTFMAVFRAHQYRTMVVGTGSRRVDNMCDRDEIEVVTLMFRHINNVRAVGEFGLTTFCRKLYEAVVMNTSYVSIDGSRVSLEKKYLSYEKLSATLSDPDTVEHTFLLSKCMVIETRTQQTTPSSMLFRPTTKGLRYYNADLADLAATVIGKFCVGFVETSHKLDIIVAQPLSNVLTFLVSDSTLETKLRHFSAVYPGTKWWVKRVKSGVLVSGGACDGFEQYEPAFGITLTAECDTVVEYTECDLWALVDKEVHLPLPSGSAALDSSVADPWSSSHKFIASDPLVAGPGLCTSDASDVATASRRRLSVYLRNRRFIKEVIHGDNHVVDKLLKVDVCENLAGLLLSPKVVSRGHNGVVHELLGDYCLQLLLAVHITTIKCLNFDVNKFSKEEKLYKGMAARAPFVIDRKKKLLLKLTSIVSRSRCTYEEFTDTYRCIKEMEVFHPMVQLQSLARTLDDWVVFDPKSVVFVQGVAGCGKTTFIRTLFNTAKCNMLVLTATCESATELKMCKALTMTSFIQNYKVLNVDLLLIDEAIMVHEGLLVLVIALSGAKKTILLGDKFQIRFVHGSSLRRPSTYSLFSLPILHMELRHTYRLPQDVASLLMSVYGNITTSNTVKESLSAHVASNPFGHVASVMSMYGKEVLLACFTQATKTLLMDRFPGYKVLTVHEAQGKTFSHVILVRDTHHSVTLFEPLASDINPWMLVALTRHKKTMMYVTVVADYLYSRIVNLKHATCYTRVSDNGVLNSLLRAMPPRSMSALQLKFVKTYMNQFSITQSYTDDRDGYLNFRRYCKDFSCLPAISIDNMESMLKTDVNIFFSTTYDDVSTTLVDPQLSMPIAYRQSLWRVNRPGLKLNLAMSSAASVDASNCVTKNELPRIILYSPTKVCLAPEVEGRPFYGSTNCWYTALKVLMDDAYGDYSSACQSMGIPESGKIIRFISLLIRFSYENNMILHSDLSKRANSLFVSTSDIGFGDTFKKCIYLKLYDAHVESVDEHNANYVVAYDNIPYLAYARRKTISVEIEKSMMDGVAEDTVTYGDLPNESTMRKVARKICGVFSGTTMYQCSSSQERGETVVYCDYGLECKTLDYDFINMIYRLTFNHTYREGDQYSRGVVDSWFPKTIVAEGVRFNDAEMMDYRSDIPIKWAPTVSTCYYGRLSNKPSDLLQAVVKRNLNVPKLQSLVEANIFARHNIRLFIDRCCKSKMALQKFIDEPISCTDEVKLGWLKTLTGVKLRTLLSVKEDVFEVSNNVYDMHLKLDPKASGDGRYDEDVPKGQVIAAISKLLNSYFSPVFRVMLTRVLNVLHSKIIYGSKLNVEDLNVLVNANLDANTTYNFYELDVSSYDKSINASTYMIFEGLMRLFGVNPDDVEFWRDIHYVNIARSRNGIKFDRFYQTISGDSATALSNTLINLICNIDLVEKAELVLVFGDDSLFVTKVPLPDETVMRVSLDRANEFNLETKLTHRVGHGYFCGMYLVSSGSSWKFLPDPIKRMEKLGNTGYNKETDFLALAISAADLYKHYNSYEHNFVLSSILNEVHNNGLNYDDVMCELYKVHISPPLFMEFYKANGGNE